MTNELKEITKRIDEEFKKYFISDADMETIFVVGSMAKEDYQDRIDNDYDIRVICKEVNSEKIVNFEKFLEKLCKTLTTETIEVGFSCLVGPVNHKVSKSKKNILIHAMIHRKDQMNTFLPITHQYQYGSRYRIVYGKDSLKKFNDVRYNIEDLVNAHEGLDYCIDMLKKQEYRYLTWDTNEDSCEFNYHIVPISQEVLMEICFYSVNKFVDNLMNCCNWEGYDIPQDKMIFCIRLLGQANINENTLFLLQGLFTKRESILKTLFSNPVKETIELLEHFKLYIKYIDSIFPKKEEIKKKKLIRS